MCHTVSNLHSRNVPALLYLLDWVCFTDKLESSFQDIISQFNVNILQIHSYLKEIKKGLNPR